MIFLAVIFSLCFAKWCEKEIQGFCERVNRQVYQDYHNLIGGVDMFSAFQAASYLKTKSTPFTLSFYFVFPVIVLVSPHYAIATLFALLYFLSVLDYYYHLTDSRYVAFIFILVLILKIENAYIESVIFTFFFFSGIFIFSKWYYKKEVFGMGDILLFIALSPLFSLEEMLQLILFSCVFGIAFWLLYFCKTRRKLARLPFIPFISVATLYLFFG